MKSINILLVVIICLIAFSCANVILKNTKNNTVHIAKLNDLYELGDTVYQDGVKLEIVRKKLENGSVIRKEAYIQPLKEVVPVPVTTVKETPKEIKK